VENPALDEWAQIEGFAAASGLPRPCSGAEIERIMAMMRERKPPASETGLSLLAERQS
jgi:hypothetical protein